MVGSLHPGRRRITERAFAEDGVLATVFIDGRALIGFGIAVGGVRINRQAEGSKKWASRWANRIRDAVLKDD